MKKFFENPGILAQLPALIAVLILFPIFGTTATDAPVKVDASFYIWQTALCVLVLVEHVFFMKKEGEVHMSGTARPIVLAFFLVSFVLTILNLMRYQ
jgi:hypothetical protein